MTDTPNIADLGMLRVDDYRDQDGIVFLTGLLDRYGECVRYQTGVGRFIVINHPSVVHELSRNDNFRRLSFLQIVLGQGLLTSEGAWWRRQRQLAQPMFTPERVSAFGDLWTAQTLERLPAWRAHADSGEPLDVADEMTRLALNIVLRALFGYEVAEKPVLELLQALQAVMADMSELATTAFAASQTMTPRAAARLPRHDGRARTHRCRHHRAPPRRDGDA
jgi:cytochrome P450